MAQIVTISDEVRRLVHDTRVKFDEIIRVKCQMQERARVHMERSNAVNTRQWEDDDLAVAGNSVGPEDLSSLWAAISEVNEMLARLFQAFERETDTR